MTMSDLAAGFAQGVGSTFPGAQAQTNHLDMQQQSVDLEKRKFQHEVDMGGPPPDPEEVKLQRSLLLREQKAKTARAENLATPDVLAAEAAGVKGGFQAQAAEGDAAILEARKNAAIAQAGILQADEISKRASTTDDALKIANQMRNAELEGIKLRNAGMISDNEMRAVDAKYAASKARLQMQRSRQEIAKAGIDIDESILRKRILKFEANPKVLETKLAMQQAELAGLLGRNQLNDVQRQQILEESALRRLSILDEVSGAKTSRDILAEHAKDAARFMMQTYDATGDVGAAQEASSAIESILNSKDIIERSGITDRSLVGAYREALGKLKGVQGVSNADVARPGMLSQIASTLGLIAEKVSPGDASAKSAQASSTAATKTQQSLLNPLGALRGSEKKAFGRAVSMATGGPYNPQAEYPSTALSTSASPDTASKVAKSYMNLSEGKIPVFVNDHVITLPKNDAYSGKELEAAKEFDRLFSAIENPKADQFWTELTTGGTGMAARKAALSTVPTESELKAMKKAWVQWSTGKLPFKDGYDKFGDIFLAAKQHEWSR